VSLNEEQEFPEDDVDYGTGEGAAYGGPDADVPLFLAHGENAGSDPKDNREHEQSDDSNKRGIIRLIGLIFAKIKRTFFSSAAGWSALASVVVAVATVIYTTYAHRQWSVMSGQLEEMKNSTKASERAAYASCLSAQLARSTLLEIQAGSADTHKLAIGSLTQAAAATRSEAALMKLKFGELSPPEPLILGAKLQIENVGKSAAFDVKIETEIRVMDIGKEPDFTYTAPAMNTDQIGFAYPNDPEPDLVVYLRDSARNPKKLSTEILRASEHSRPIESSIAESHIVTFLELSTGYTSVPTTKFLMSDTVNIPSAQPTTKWIRLL
jgi:hypothetical protein